MNACTLCTTSAFQHKHAPCTQLTVFLDSFVQYLNSYGTEMKAGNFVGQQQHVKLPTMRWYLSQQLLARVHVTHAKKAILLDYDYNL